MNSNPCKQENKQTKANTHTHTHKKCPYNNVGKYLSNVNIYSKRKKAFNKVMKMMRDFIFVYGKDYKSFGFQMNSIIVFIDHTNVITKLLDNCLK